MADPSRKVLRFSSEFWRRKVSAAEMPADYAPTLPESLDLTWPSGAGHEVGVLTTTLEGAWALAKQNAERTRHHFTMFEVVEDGMTAIVIQGLADTPISLIDEEIEGQTGLGIIVDRNSTAASVAKVLDSLFPGKVEFGELAS